MTSRTVAEHAAAIERLLAPLLALPAEPVPLLAAAGRRTAAAVVAPIDLPVFRNSQMDGYAVRAASVATVPVTLPVAGTVAAGDVGGRLPDGAAIKIMTGAPIPEHADCVVPVEDTVTEPGAVRIRRGRVAGEFVREPGSDVRAGVTLLGAGVSVAPRHIAALAAAGVARVSVQRRVRVAVITTGDELVPAGSPLPPGHIYDSNGIALAACASADGADVATVAHSSDDPAEFRRILDAAAATADVVFTSGGVSMGDFEVVRETLQPLGGVFGHVGMQPGGPQGMSIVNGVAVLSFPGNPVSTLVSYAVYARPLLRRAAGLPPIDPETCTSTAELRSPAGKRQFLRGKRTAAGVEPVAGPGSHLIASMARADVLIDVPADVTHVPVGADVRVWAL